MNADTYLARIDQLGQKNRLLILALVLMVIFNGMNWLSLVRAKNEVRTVIYPVGVSTPLQVGNASASPEYLRHMARYVTSMVGSWTASTAKNQFHELLGLFAPDAAGRAQVELEQLAAQIERFPSISSSLRWSGEDALRAAPGILQVRAAKDRLVNGDVTETNAVFYCIRYRIEDSRFWLLSVEEREGQTTADICMLPSDPPQLPLPQTKENTDVSNRENAVTADAVARR